MSDEPSSAEPSALKVIHSMKTTNPPGAFQLGSDGVMRSYGPAPEFLVLDAVGFSPSQIKQILDLGDWSQEAEDKFRGVNGRKVTDREALFQPPESDRPKSVTEEEKQEGRKYVEETNRRMLETIERERLKGVDVAEKYACGKPKSDHDLRPKE